VLELCVGYPHALVRAVGHPVTWIGGLIAALDNLLNRESLDPRWRKAAGVIALLIVLGIAGTIAFVVEHALLRLPFGWFAVAAIASTLIAQRSLHDHAAEVAGALHNIGLDAGRAAVAKMVGRDTATLDAAGVARAAIESLAENFSDGVVAPVFWLAIAGLPGATLYKAINTADSMIGYRTPRHEAFGWTAARLDDLVNLPASRLSALLLVAAATLSKDASTAAAWRGLALAGPRVYGGVIVEDATIGDGRRDATFADIRRALRLYRRADAILLALVAATALLIAPI